MFPLYRNQSVDFSANQLTGFYMMGTLVVKGLIGKLYKYIHTYIHTYINAEIVTQRKCRGSRARCYAVFVGIMPCPLKVTQR